MIGPNKNGFRKTTNEDHNGKGTPMSHHFETSPSANYEQAVSALGTLLKSEGEDTVMRAFAEAVWEVRQTAFAQRHGVQSAEDSHVCLHRLVGENCPAETCDSPQIIPAGDHVSEWTKGGRTVVIVAQPYGLSHDQLRAIVSFCEEHNLRASIGAQPSWHFPGSTIAVEYRQTGTSEA